MFVADVQTVKRHILATERLIRRAKQEKKPATVAKLKYEALLLCRMRNERLRGHGLRDAWEYYCDVMTGAAKVPGSQAVES
jgi:hypothetical protein